MMNKDEAVQRISKGGCLSIAHAEDLYDSIVPKPVVPQYVADWYEKYKFNLNSDIFHLIRTWDTENRNSDFYHWFDDTKNNSIQTLVNMHQFGYEVEKEPRYTVEIKGFQKGKNFLNYDRFSKKWSFDDSDTSLERFRAIHTRKELEDADFSWVLSCEGMEVKEVE